MIRLFEDKKVFLGLQQSVQSTVFKYLTTAPETQISSLNETKGTSRRYLIRRSKQESQPYNKSFVADLFCGVFDKEYFKYPSVLENNAFSNLLEHSAEVENFVKRYKSGSQLCVDSSNIINSLKSLELAGLCAPQNYGGLGYSVTETLFIEECLNLSPKLGRILAFNLNFGAQLLTLFGNEHQKMKYLPKIASGELITSFAYCEHGSIVDMKNIKTTCIFDKTKNSFIVNGKKQYVLNANHADLFAVLGTGKKEHDDSVELLLHLLLIDKCTPGVTIRKLYNSKTGNELGLFDITLKNVVVPQENLIGDLNKSSLGIVKCLLSHNQLSASASCLTFIKYILHSASQFCIGQSLKEQGFVQTNIGILTMYTYVTESLLYFLAGRFDKFYNPNLFLESSIVKVLAVDYLDLAIKKFIGILGNESYKLPSLLEQALEVLHFNVSLLENNIHLKTFLAHIGLINAVHSSTTLRENINVSRNPFYHPQKAMKLFTTSLNSRLKKLMIYDFKQELHTSLKESANILEEALGKLYLAVENHVTVHGIEATNVGFHTIKLSEMAINIYALTACLSRASNSYCHNMTNSINEINIANVFARHVKVQIDHLYDEITKFTDCPENYRYIGACTFEEKQYPVEHPLTRTY
ncbi:hypothetical protein RUM44_013039 [Polyplax serrata]|uniref:Uncharacterized protein n=1 Tax=Polyplax serrata TaxID=468196 RepID=A0ABR1BHD8_POLSC